MVEIKNMMLYGIVNMKNIVIHTYCFINALKVLRTNLCMSSLLLKLLQIYEFIGNVSKYLEKKFVNRDYLRNFAPAF